MTYKVGDWAVYTGPEYRNGREVKIVAQMGEFDLYRIDGIIGSKGAMEMKDVTSADLSPIPFPVGTICYFEGERMRVTEIMWNHSRSLAWVDDPKKPHPAYGTFAFLSKLSLVDPNKPQSYEELQAENAELRATIDRMLRERSGVPQWGNPIKYPETAPFEFPIEWGEAGYPITVSLSMMDHDDRAAFVGRVSQLLYRYMGGSPHAQAMAIMKDLTGEPS